MRNSSHADPDRPAPLLPEPMHMSVADALRLNLWAGVAVLASLVSRLLLREHEAVTGLVRAGVALLPILPGLLWMRAIGRWIRGLDELQQRLQWEGVALAASGMLLIALVADLLRVGGMARGFTFGWEGFFALGFLLYAAGLTLANRRWR